MRTTRSGKFFAQIVVGILLLMQWMMPAFAAHKHHVLKHKKTITHVVHKRQATVRMVTPTKHNKVSAVTKPKRTTHTTKKVAESSPLPLRIDGTSMLALQLNNIIAKGNPDASVAVYVRGMQDNTLLYARNVNQTMTPASTLKILTAEAGLLFLGPEYRFSTQLLTDGKTIKNGVLQGNLYLVFSGDPSLTHYDVLDILLTLKAHRINAISGNVYVDTSAYDQNYYGPGWMSKDPEHSYGAPIAASIINQNSLAYPVSPVKKSGSLAEVAAMPTFPYAAKSSPGCHITKGPSNILSLRNCMTLTSFSKGGSEVVGDVINFDRALVSVFLNQLNIRVAGQILSGNAPTHLSLIGMHVSKPLKQLVNTMLKKSNNIIAGALFKKIGQLYNAAPGSWENGKSAVEKILATRAGVNVTGMRILDGSGLSPDDSVSPAQMMQVLNFAYHNDKTSDDFISALPIAGVDGTLKQRMGNITRKVLAKTGTISGVASLAGYAESADKESLAFVIMFNGSKGNGWRYRAVEDRIATALTRFHR